MKNLVRELRPAPEKGFEHRFETPAGQQAQVDFAHLERLDLGGREVPILVDRDEALVVAFGECRTAN